MSKHELTIEDRVYVTALIPPIQAIALHARLLGMLGGGVSGVSLQGVNDIKQGTQVIGSLLSSVDPEKLPSLITDMCSLVMYGGDKITKENFDSHFTQYPNDLYPLVSWVIYLNTKDFLAKSGHGWKALMSEVGLTFQKIGKTSTS